MMEGTKMNWLNEHYPKAIKLDDYGMRGRDFPPEVIDYVHANWTMTDGIYVKPLYLKNIKPIEIRNVDAILKVDNTINPVEMDDKNKPTL